MSSDNNLPTQIGDVSADLTAFFTKQIDPNTTLLDVKHILSASLVGGDGGMGEDHGGLSGSMARIQLTYTSDPASASYLHRPAVVICKSNRDSDASRAQAKSMQLPREAMFLKEVRNLQVMLAKQNHADASHDAAAAASSSPLVTRMAAHAPTLIHGLPTIYYSEGSMEAGTKMIICEDLGVGRDVTVGAATVAVQGIQSGWLLGPHSILNRSMGVEGLQALIHKKGWAVAEEEEKDKESSSALCPVRRLDLVTQSFLEAAELHGAFWMKGEELLATDGAAEKKSDAPVHYLRGAKWFLSSETNKKPAFYDEGKTLYDGSMGFAHHNWQGYLKRVAAADNTTVIPPNVVALMAQCCPSDSAHHTPSYDRFLEAFSSERPHTLVHGDFHPGNMMVCGGEGGEGTFPYRIALVDWEVVGIGSGPQDIGQYMTSHFNKEQFETLAVPAVEAYVEALVSIIEKQQTNIATAEASSLRGTIRREIVLGALGRWAWLLGVMGGMASISLEAMDFFNGQVDAFMSWAMANAEVMNVPATADALAKAVEMCRP